MSTSASAPEPAKAEATAPEAVCEIEPKKSTLARVFHAFTYKEFRLLWFGAFTSSAGTHLQEAALSWIIYQLTHKARYTGILAFAATAPVLLFTLIGGVLADRIDRRRILLVSQWTQLTCALTLGLLTFLNAPTLVLVWSAVALAFIAGCAQSFGGPAYQALIPTLVEKKDLPNAIALNSIQFHLARVVGPTISTIPFAVMCNQLLAASISFGFNGLSFLAVIFSLITMRVGYIPQGKGDGIRVEMLQGLKFVWHQEALRSLTVLSFGATALGLQAMAFSAVLATDVFRTGPRGNATLIAISGAGSVFGALIVAGLSNIKNRGRTALLMQIALGVTIIAFTLAKSVWVAYSLIFVASIFMMFVFSMIASLVQLIVTDEMRGRVMSIYMLSFRGGAPLGALATGFLAEHYPLTKVLMVEGVLLCVLALTFLLSPSKVKKY
ncbi:MAG: MFS transporter [Blastocatellia bacterium]